MKAQNPDRLLDGLQATAHRAVRPGIEELVCRTVEDIAPKLGHVLLYVPPPAGLRVALVRGPKRHRLSSAFVGAAFESAHFTSIN